MKSINKIGSLGIIVCTFLILLFTSEISQAQIAQYRIFSPGRQELANLAKALPDGSTVMAGSIYDINSGGNTVQEDIVLTRVSSNGNLMWSKQFGTPGQPNASDAPCDMIISADGNIVVTGVLTKQVGYFGGNAFIAKIDVNSGAILWWKTVRDQNTAGSPGGEVYYGIAQLQNNNFVAVGVNNSVAGYVRSLISVFDNSGSLIYHETFNATGSDDLLGVVAEGNSVYVSTWQVGATYKDLKLFKYTPSSTSGIFNWESAWDLTNHKNYAGTTLGSNGFGKPYLRGNKLIIGGGSTQYFSPGNGSGQFVFSCKTDGTTAKVYSVNPTSSSLKHSSNGSIYPINENDVFSVQSPSINWVNAFIAQPSANYSDAYISSISGLNIGSLPALVTTKTFPYAGTQSLFSIDYDPTKSLLHTSGAVNTNSTGNNDIYLLKSKTDFSSQSQQCGLTTPEMSLTSVTLVAQVINRAPVARLFNTISAVPDVVNPMLNIERLCGDDIPPTDPPPTGCKEDCYWKLSGNNLVTSTHVLGPLNYEDIRFVTNGTQRAILEKDFGRFGINTPTPTARLHVLCSPEENSDVRFENLKYGIGGLLVIDKDGYVYKDQYTQERSANEMGKLSQEIQQLKQELAQLKAMLINGSSSPTGDGFIKNKGDIKISPNPSKGLFNVTLLNHTGNNQMQVFVIDASGRVIYTGPMTGNNLTVDGSSWVKGYYYVSVKDGESTINGGKIIIE